MSRQPTAAPQCQSAGLTHGPLLQRACACGQHTSGGGECESCKKKRLSLQRSAVRDIAPDLAPPIVHEVLRSPGQPLDGGTRAQMESHFHKDFCRVRVHTNARAAASAQAVNALAYTVGSNVAFDAGKYQPQTDQGRKLIAHELAHVIQQPAGFPGTDLAISPANDRFEVEARLASNGAAFGVSRLPGAALQRQPAAGASACSTRTPESCVIYEDWIRQFQSLPAFIPQDAERNTRQTQPSTGNRTGVLGSGAATGTTLPPAPISSNPADHFIDRPTQAWVDQNFNEELRTMAYQLPADCADIAVILRHVWLFAHQRSETYRGWGVGFRSRETGAARERRIHRLIRNDVSSLNVAEMVNQYTDEQGRPLRSFQDLQHVLHPGDVLVIERRWDRIDGPRASGHTLTIETVQRNERTGEVTSITALQGNQPLGEREANIIRPQQQAAGETQTSVSSLRAAPGRRIERSTWSGSRLNDIGGIWAYQDTVRDRTRFNVFIAAGPVRSATLPGRRPRQGTPGRLGRPTDWLPALRRASRAALQPTFEAALQSARSFLEGGRPFRQTEARGLGQAAGERLWSLAQNGGLGYAEHFQPLHEMRQVLAAMRRTTRAVAGVQEAFDAIDEGLRLGARGVTTIDFRRRGRRSERLFNILLMGFDPFFTDAARGALPGPRPGEWNPSGAAVMALDGERVAGDQAAAAVEGVVLPVSYQAFRGGSGREGIVEHVLGPRVNQLDAVITVSQDPNLDRDLQNQDERVRIESQAVGVHQLRPIQTHQDLPSEGTAFGLERVPRGTGNADAPLILSTSGVDLPALAGETAQSGRGRRPPVAAPDISDTLTLGFNSELDASRARQALNLTPQSTYHTQQVRQPPAAPLRPGKAVLPNRTFYTTKFNDAALRQILNTMQNAGGTEITFEGLRGQRLRATVLSGPGGSFLSNEVSYRTRRALRGAAAGRDPVTFHVHTPRGGIVPTEGTPAPAQGATTPQAAVRRRRVVIQTLRRMIRALVGQLSRRRTGSTP